MTNRISRGAFPMFLGLAFALALPKSALPRDIIPPPVPGNIQVEQGNVPFFVGHGVGMQNYVCLPSASGVGFVLFTPEATLLGNDEKQLTTHFFSPNPFEANGNPALTAIVTSTRP